MNFYGENQKKICSDLPRNYPGINFPSVYEATEGTFVPYIFRKVNLMWLFQCMHKDLTSITVAISLIQKVTLVKQVKKKNNVLTWSLIEHGFICAFFYQ
jgi:hypothetical protein